MLYLMGHVTRALCVPVPMFRPITLPTLPTLISMNPLPSSIYPCHVLYNRQ